MSFSSKVKESLCTVYNKPCCEKAELYGFLLFSQQFSMEKIRICPSSERMFRRYERTLKRLGIACDAVYSSSLGYRLDFAPNADFIDYFGSACFDLTCLDMILLDSDCCKRAFFRGAFLARGTVSDPERSYHLEWKTAYEAIAHQFASLTEEFDVPAKVSSRRGMYVIYLKASELIKDMLSVLGATELMFDYANAEIVKNIRNSVNRATNCEFANIEKTVSASEEQIRCIEKLIADGYTFENPQLDEIARLRLQYPTESLTFLGAHCIPPLSKAGVAHRLKKITEIAKQQ